MKIRSFLIGSMLLTGAQFSFAQQAVTDPVGGRVLDLAGGNQLVSVPFQNPKLIQGAVTVDGTSVTFASLPVIQLPAYIQVVSSASATGEVMTIASINGSTVTLLDTVPGLATDDVVAVREHITMADVTEMFEAFQGDLVSLFDENGSQVVLEYFDGYGWYYAVQDQNADSFIVHPGEGFVYNAESPRSVVMFGSVSVDPVNYPVSGGRAINLIGTMDPVSGGAAGSIFGEVAEGSLFSTFETVNGNFQNTALIEYFAGYGWYDAVADQNADNYLINSGSAGVFQGPSGQTLVHPPAFTEQ